MVQLIRCGPCGYGLVNSTGWHDWSDGTDRVADSQSNPNEVLLGRQYTTFTSGGWTWYNHPWCSGNTHVVSTGFVFRIHNKVTNSWGAWYTSASSNYAIVC